MNSLPHLPLLSSLGYLGLVLLGCSSDSFTPVEEDVTCTQHSDCPESTPSFCDTQSLRCLPLCSSDSECSPLACRNGRCVEPPSAATVAYCRVTPDFVIGRPGLRVHFYVEMQDAAGEPVVLADGIVWTAASEAVSGGGAGSRADFTLVVPGTTGEAVEARMGTTSCRAQVTVLSAGVPPGQVRILVTNDLTGRPISGAVVAASDAQGIITGSSETDALGVAWVPATGVVNLTVFHEAHNYLTLVNYDTQQGTRDIALPLRAYPTRDFGGVRGTFTKLPASQQLLMGFTGLSIPALGLDLDNRQLSDPSIGRTLTLLGKQYETELPSNSYISLSSTVFKAEYSAPGVVGVCDERLMGISDVEQSIRAGACSTRTSWAFTGEVPPSALNLKGFEPEVTFFQVLMESPTVMRHFGSSVVRDVQFQLKHRKWKPHAQFSSADTAHYTQVNHSFQQLPLAFKLAVELPKPPEHFGAPMARIVLVGAVNTPGQGLTPLGLGAVRLQVDSQPPQLARVYMAPAHHGLEGNPYRLIVLTTDEAAWSPYVKGGAMSLLSVPLMSLRSEATAGYPMKFPRDFLPPPVGARFNFNPVSDGHLKGRQFRFITQPVLDDVTVLRVLFTNDANRIWVVLMDPSHAMTGFRLPMPPGNFSDRTRQRDNLWGRSVLNVQAIVARTALGESLNPRTLAEQEEASLAQLTDFILAFSQFSYARPGLNWVVPASVDMSILHSGTVTVALRDFRVSSAPEDDGHVLLSFEGGTDCSGNDLFATLSTDKAQGEVHFKFPLSCRGTQVRMTATLVDAQGVPLSPPIRITRLIDII